MDVSPERASPHPFANRVERVVWGVVYVFLFRPSPRNLHRWRNWLLRLFGARLHPTARFYPKAKCWLPRNLVMEEGACIGDYVDAYCVERITVGAHSTVSQYSFLCGATHDYEDPRHPMIARPITIGKQCWIAADVFVAPGVTIADGTVIGARSSVFGDLPAWVVAAGTPAKPIHPRRPQAEGADDEHPAEEPTPASTDLESREPAFSSKRAARRTKPSPRGASD
ncbi:MAG: LbetaH domain-containing protein [Planctomycetota bacterium]|jgi:putative colanic acid biosynthesis acetyltransferase WcaF